MKRATTINLGPTLLMLFVMVLPTVLAISANDMMAEPRDNHLVFTDDPFVVDKLELANADVLEEYGAFALVKAKRSSLKGFDVMDTPYRLDTVELQRATIDHREGEPALPKGLSIDMDGYGDHNHYIVQFYGPIKEEWKYEIEAMGGFIDDYLPNNAFIVGMDLDTKEKVASYEKVQWIGMYHPIYKVQPRLDPLVGSIDVYAIIFDDVDLERTLKDIGDFADIDFVDLTTHIKVGITLSTDDLPRLARIDGVKWIELEPVWIPHTTTSTWIIQTRTQSAVTLYDNGIHGENQTVFNSDTGISVAHEAFHDSQRSVQFSTPASNNPPDNQHRKIVNYWTFANDHDMAGAGYHGTHTNGNTAGYAVPNGGNFKGIAYAAKVSFGDIFYDTGGNGIPSNLNNLFQKAANDGAYLASNSWGQWGSRGIYDSESQEVDEFMWNNKDFQILYSAGNDGSSAGSVSTPATGKNIMAIGAADNNNNGDLKGYSSRGPTDDGRLKPTLYTPTDQIAPCGGSSCGTTTYASAGGTSNSCPAAAGGMALLRQYFTDGFYPSGTRKAVDTIAPSSALMRATAINGAEETNGNGGHDHSYNGMPFPNNDQGWGYMNLDGALYFQGDAKKLWIDDHTTGLTTGGSVEYYLSVKDSAVPLEITVAWTDYKGATGAATELVNNLDVTIEGPGGTTYKGNVWRTAGTPHESVTGGAADAKNVEENFYLQSPSTGGYTVTVTAINIAQGTQPFALVATGDFVRDPDLAIYKQEIQREPIGVPVEGEYVYLNGTVHNYGGLVAALVPMDTYVDGEKVGSESFDFSLTDQEDFSFAWEAEAGFHDFRFVIDPLDIVTEGDEDNNEATINIWVNGLPEANVTVTPVDPLTKETVLIDASGSTDDGVITWYRFDFGDGSKTNWVKMPTTNHNYNDDGVYNVSCWVKDNMSKVSEPAVTQVTVMNRAPHVNATAAVYEAYTFFEISFDGARSNDEDGSITFLWDFADGITSEDDRPKHNWSDNGLYQVTLTVTDDDGAQNTTSLNINILNQLPTVYFESNVYRGNVTTGFEFNGSAWDHDGMIEEWVWAFGDGNTSDEEDPVYHYSDNGEFVVTLYVLDDDGALSNVMNTTVIIDNLPPLANMSASSLEVLTLEDIKFTDHSEDLDGRIISYTWSMGDGKFHTDPDPTHQYKENGVYTVRLTVQDDDGDQTSYEIRVKVDNRAPEAKAIYNQTAYVGVLVLFTANQSTDMDGEIRSYEWKFDTSDSKVGINVQHAFWEPGVHNFTLSVKDNDGANDTIELSITIEKKPVPPPVTPLGEGLQGLFSLLLIVIVIGGIVGGLVFGLKYRKKRTKGSGVADKVATLPPTEGEAHTMDSDFSGGFQYPAYDQQVEAQPFYDGEAQSDPAYDYGEGSGDPEPQPKKNLWDDWGDQ